MPLTFAILNQQSSYCIGHPLHSLQHRLCSKAIHGDDSPYRVHEKIKSIEQNWIFITIGSVIVPSVTLNFKPPWFPFLYFELIICRNIKSKISGILIFFVHFVWQSRCLRIIEELYIQSWASGHGYNHYCIPDRRWWILKFGKLASSKELFWVKILSKTFSTLTRILKHNLISKHNLTLEASG